MARGAVFVSGVSKGSISAALVPAFQKEGFTVFAGVTEPTFGAEFGTLQNVHTMVLDTTSEQSIAAAVEFVEKQSPGGLDILMNSCRDEFVMPLLDCSMAEGKRMFDINIWGTLAMVKAFSPLLIKNKGTVVNISSVSGRINTPWLGLYASSMSAVTTMSETLRLELAPFGVKVLTIVSAAVEADIYKKEGEFLLPSNSFYKPIESKIAAVAEGKVDPTMTPANIYAAKVVQDVLKGKTGLVYRGNMASMTYYISWLPSILLDGMISAKRGLEDLSAYFQKRSD